MKLKLILAKLFQFVTFVLFTFMALVYFGALLMVALAVLWYAVRILTVIGLPSMIAVPAGVAAFAYAGWTVSKAPELYQLLLGIGVGLVAFGKDQIKRFDPIIAAARGESA
jgi:hypothetical protein